MSGEEDVSLLVILGSVAILAAASIYVWARQAKRQARRSWPRIVVPIEEACRSEHYRTKRS